MSTRGRDWSVPVRIDDIPAIGRRFELDADAATRAALARAARLSALPRLQAVFDVTRHRGGGLHVAGTVSATVGQTCVVTLEPIENEIEETVDLIFAPSRPVAAHAHGEERERTVAAAEEPEALIDGGVDLGAIATEFLILGIDPYPRTAGAVFAAPPAAEAAYNPFAALAALKKRQGDRQG